MCTDRRTDEQTNRQNDYCNPRCACAPRVNYIYVLYNFAFSLCIYIKNISVRPPPLLPTASGFHLETLTIGGGGEVGGVT